jgi:hypothetical protein
VSGPLAKGWFQAIKPWVNTEQWGVFIKRKPKFNPDGVLEDGRESPVFCIKQEAWVLWPRWCRGERDLTYEDGKPFYPWHVHKTLAAADVHRMIAEAKKAYYTAGGYGRAMFMADGDAHDGQSQEDLDLLHADVAEFIPADARFHVNSTRGFNDHVRVEYHGHTPWELNEKLDQLDRLLKQLASQRGRSCDIEIKGHYGDRKHYGSLAKLPCHGEGANRLEEFKALRVLAWDDLLNIIQALRIEIRASAPQQDAPPKQDASPGKKKRGSTTGLPFTDGQLDLAPGLVEAHRNRAFHCYATRNDNHMGKYTRAVVTVEDFEYAFVCLDYAHACAKKDMDLPFNFIKRMWQKLYALGHFERQFSGARWKLLRQTIWDRGYSEQENTDYWHHPTDKGKSQCMRWRLRDEYAALVLEQDGAVEERGGDIGITETAMPKGCPGMHYPQRLPPPDFYPPQAQKSFREAQELREMEALLAGIVQPGLAWDAYGGDDTSWRLQALGSEDEDGQGL